MSTRRNKTPKLCLHKATGQAFVRLEGKPLYLGKYGTPKAQRAYAHILAQLSDQAEIHEGTLVEQTVFSPRKTTDLTIVELLAAYWPHAEREYRKHGEPTRSHDNIRLALRPLAKLYGVLPVREFGPLKLTALRDWIINQKTSAGESLSRGVINERVRMIRSVFKWGVSQEMVPETVHRALLSVAGLRQGRSRARETKPVGPVADEVIEATLPHLPRIVADMVRFQRLTGCRPGEVCSLRPCDVIRFDKPPTLFAGPSAPLKPLDVWEYRPSRHKTEHHGKQRVIVIGPRAQAVLGPYLLRPDNAYVFSPIENAELRSKGRGRANCTRFSKDTYGQVIVRACDQAFPPPETMTDELEVLAWKKAHRWRPNRIRHTTATALRKEVGLEKTRSVLGHSKTTTTEIYAERDLSEAASIMRKMG
jgi:integrase